MDRGRLAWHSEGAEQRMNTTDLSTFRNESYVPGASRATRVLWYFANAVFFASRFPVNSVKIVLLRMFGARVGRGVVIKPNVNIKSPWYLEIGNHAWIGEAVWIDNLVPVHVGRNACVSQGALLLTGNHNYRKSTFDLMTGEITIEDGAWVGAKSVVCPGVRCGTHSVLTVGSVTATDLEPYGIYQGNPAAKVRQRVIE
jgi:putative colanic acid biosynthesis acetyltransferase WcaF